MQVTLNGKRITLQPKDVLGVGGEASVFRVGQSAVKVYLDPTAERDRKLRALINVVKCLPASAIAPQELVWDKTRKQVIGFTMQLLTADHLEVRKLSTKNYRAQSGITTVQVVQLFLDAYQSLAAIHRAGMVVGDLNDLNLMFRTAKACEMVYIDVDSFQFDQYPCVVGTELFLDPALYGCNLAQQPYFRPENDWYSFAVLLFKSLLLAHPYGGVHPRFQTLIERARNSVSVFDPAVTYPRIAYSPDLLSNDLAHTFDQWFSRGYRGIFPEKALIDYLDSLMLCPSCKAAYPSTRARCPFCSTYQPTPVQSCQPVIVTSGQIVAWSICDQTVNALAHEDGKAILYISEGLQAPRKVSLFEALPFATYAFLDDKLIVAPAPDSEELLVLDIAGTQAQGVLKTTTGLFANQTPMFGVSGTALYRLTGGYLMRCRFQNGMLIDQPIMAVAENQTWFKVSTAHPQRLFGFFRTLNTYHYWLLDGPELHDAALPALEPGEFIIETDVKFAATTCLIVRHSQLNGVDRIRLDEIDASGKVVQSRLITGGADFVPLGAYAYRANVILHATDSGVVQERLDTQARRTFTTTEPFVKQGDSLHPFGDGLLIISERRILYMK